MIRSIWAYGSQSRLILWAIVAFVLGFLIRLLHSDAAVAAVGGANDWLKPVAGWIAAHGDWFDRASEILYLLGALAIALNLWRALQFSNILLRGSRLLTSEVRERRQDLDARSARLNQRVATLTAEAEAAARRAQAASERVGGKTAVRAPGPEFLDSGHAPSASAREFLAALSMRVGRSAGSGPAPDRLIVVVDNLDALAPEAAANWIDAAQGVIGQGCVGLLAFDPVRLAAALGGPVEARRRLGKWLQVTVNLPARKAGEGEAVVARLLVARPAARLRAGSGGRRGARRAAVERRDDAARRARAPGRAFAARGQALPQRLSPGALLERPAPRHGADAGRGLRRRRCAGGAAVAPH